MSLAATSVACYATYGALSGVQEGEPRDSGVLRNLIVMVTSAEQRGADTPSLAVGPKARMLKDGSADKLKKKTKEKLIKGEARIMPSTGLDRRMHVHTLTR